MSQQSDNDRDANESPSGRKADDWAQAARARADRLHQRGPATPPPREPDKAWYRQLPAKLAGSVVFLVALTTLVGNLLELREKGGTVLPTAAPATPTTGLPGPGQQGQGQPASGQPGAPSLPPGDGGVATGPVRLQLALDRIAVEHDGSPGTTDWRFTVEADGQPLLAFGQDDLDDTGGRNVVRPKDLSAALRLQPDTTSKLSVRGWRLSRFRMQGKPDVNGEATLTPSAGDMAVKVNAAEAEGGTFVFYFSADPR